MRSTSWQATFLFFLTWIIHLPVVALRDAPTAMFPAFSHSDGAIDGLLARSNIFTRQRRICPFSGGVFCSDDGRTCCPSGSFCLSGGYCCPNSAITGCGNSCCAPRPDIYCCTTSSTGCCVDTGVAPPPPVRTSTARIAQTASASATAVVKTATASFTLAAPPRPTDGRIPKATVPFDYKDILKPRPRSKEKDPVVRKAAVDSLFENMCLGIQKFGNLLSQSIVLTHSPSSADENRKEACGHVVCQAGESCDEFPLASTAEGGLGAIANCIIALGNSIQGGFIRWLRSSRRIGDGDHYLLQLTNVDCKDFLPKSGRRNLYRRQQISPTSGLTSQMQELDVTTFGALGASDTFDHGLYYIGDLSSGRYAVNISLINGLVSAYYIIDYQGVTYAASYLNASTTGATLDFTLPEDATGVTLMLDSVLDFDVSGSMTKLSVASAAHQRASAQIWITFLISLLGVISGTLA